MKKGGQTNVWHSSCGGRLNEMQFVLKSLMEVLHDSRYVFFIRPVA